MCLREGCRRRLRHRTRVPGRTSRRCSARCEPRFIRGARGETRTPCASSTSTICPPSSNSHASCAHLVLVSSVDCGDALHDVQFMIASLRAPPSSSRSQLYYIKDEHSALSIHQQRDSCSGSSYKQGDVGAYTCRRLYMRCVLLRVHDRDTFMGDGVV